MLGKVAAVVSGGSCPGISALLYFLRKTFPRIHFFCGWDGLLSGREVLVNANRRLLVQGGSVIGTSRYKPSDQDVEQMQRLLEFKDYDGFIAIGGNDTHSVLARFRHYRKVIGIPKTLDDDVGGTEVCLGHWSVLEHLTKAIVSTLDSIRDHGRFLVVETIGQDAGWLVLRAGPMVDASLILVPEVEVPLDRVLARVSDDPTGLIVLSESVKIPGLELPSAEEHPSDDFGTPLFLNRNVGQRLAAALREALGFDARCEVLRDSIRGGPPSAIDLHLARLFATQALQYLSIGDFPAAPQVLVVSMDGMSTTVSAAKACTRRLVTQQEYQVR